MQKERFFKEKIIVLKNNKISINLATINKSLINYIVKGKFFAQKF